MNKKIKNGIIIISIIILCLTIYGYAYVKGETEMFSYVRSKLFYCSGNCFYINKTPVVRLYNDSTAECYCEEV